MPHRLQLKGRKSVAACSLKKTEEAETARFIAPKKKFFHFLPTKKFSDILQIHRATYESVGQYEVGEFKHVWQLYPRGRYFSRVLI